MKILMLHGYTQNTATFRIKCKALTMRIRKFYSDAEFVWPDAPLKLDPRDSPIVHDGQNTEVLNLRAWFDLRFTSHPPNGLLASLNLIATVLRTQGPFDGVIAFSQGTVIAAFVASLLQGAVRQPAWTRASQAGLDVFAYPDSFRDLDHPQFDFGVLCAGRVGKEGYYDWLYENPGIETPFCHVMGRLDSMVEHDERDLAFQKISGKNSLARHLFGRLESVAKHRKRDLALKELLGEKALVRVEHGSGHCMPKDDASLDAIVGFLIENARRANEGLGRQSIVASKNLVRRARLGLDGQGAVQQGDARDLDEPVNWMKVDGDIVRCEDI